MVKEYTERWNGFQIRDIGTLIPKNKKDSEGVYKFDIVIWLKADKPYTATDFETGEKKTYTESCLSIATLTYIQEMDDWKFESIGTRFLDYYKPGLAQWVNSFRKMKNIELGGGIPYGESY